MMMAMMSSIDLTAHSAETSGCDGGGGGDKNCQEDGKSYDRQWTDERKDKKGRNIVTESVNWQC